ncbi:FemAB family protein [Hyunsoonleella jejuensis]|uniref:FemAB family protein n=1 Tax=Hyunsoonleella jejuensis TaxID=419940 RepID=A0A1H9G863_9FLAO|nr:peptidoglycan bridge formation glycyltransferase FemA/FemB family protein [Hyunsoonleella jejuensis]SEQ46316.1 FemAB family protein [Hyunsoonleella jejuensis]
MIKTITEKDEWDSLIAEFSEYDSYHTYDYHHISSSKDETPVLLIYTEDNIVIGVPLLVRSIKGTPYKDATSVYGYCGPISKGITRTFDNTQFVEALKAHLFNNNIISIFARLNPYISKQKVILDGLGEISPLGKVVNINLTLDHITQRQKYHRRLKNHANKSRRNCGIIKADNEELIEQFASIYKENMIRVNAKKMYFFNKEYFLKLVNSESFKTEILLATEKETNTIISGAVFLKSDNIVQYHLSGTKNDFLHLMPTKLLIDEMRVKSTIDGLKAFNLGGGVGANENDTLFRFKSSFSDDYHQFSVWKLIINQKVYNELCMRNAIKNSDLKFFPLYRSKEYNS